MKLTLASLLFAASMAVNSYAADATVKLTDVHLCCKSCVTGAEKAVAKVDGAKAECDADGGSITLTASDTATLQKATDALTKAGYFGKSSDPKIKVDAMTGAKGAKVQTLQVSNVHLCCPKCVKAVDTALKAVPGVKEQTAVKNAKTFEVTGDFTDKDVFAALQKAGLTGKVGPAAKE